MPTFAGNSKEQQEMGSFVLPKTNQGFPDFMEIPLKTGVLHCPESHHGKERVSLNKFTVEINVAYLDLRRADGWNVEIIISEAGPRFEVPI